jgi:hypothetical protein
MNASPQDPSIGSGNDVEPGPKRPGRAENGRRKGADTLALALAGGETLRDAARLAGVGERTAARRWADSAFRRRVCDLRGDMVQRALGRMADGMAEAAGTLRQLLAAASESVRLGAARALLEVGLKVREAVELEARLAELERQGAARGKSS